MQMIFLNIKSFDLIGMKMNQFKNLRFIPEPFPKKTFIEVQKFPE
jgi:hypothetical protein